MMSLDIPCSLYAVVATLELTGTCLILAFLPTAVDKSSVRGSLIVAENSRGSRSIVACICLRMANGTRATNWGDQGLPTHHHMLVKTRPQQLLLCVIVAPLQLQRRYHDNQLLNSASIVVCICLRKANGTRATNWGNQGLPTHHHMLVESMTPLQLQRRYHDNQLLHSASIVVCIICLRKANGTRATNWGNQGLPTHHHMLVESKRSIHGSVDYRCYTYPLPTTRRCYNFHCCCSSLHLFHLGSRSRSVSLCVIVYDDVSSTPYIGGCSITVAPMSNYSYVAPVHHSPNLPSNEVK